MSVPSRRKLASTKAAPRKRSDQESDPKSRYKVRRTIPNPVDYKPQSKGQLHDQQLAMPFVVPARVEAQPFLKWAGGKAGLLRQLEEFFPHEIDPQVDPMLGTTECRI
jgi:hypothetical protein